MKLVVGALLTLWIGATALAEPGAPTCAVAAPGECTAQALKQLERDWAAALQTGDRDKLERIVADDWTGVDGEGRKETKKQLLNQLRRTKSKTASVEFGPMDVKVLGDVAVVQGSDIETGSSDGEIWTDVFANRGGKWVAVRSQSARAAADSRPRWPI